MTVMWSKRHSHTLNARVNNFHSESNFGSVGKDLQSVIRATFRLQPVEGKPICRWRLLNLREAKGLFVLGQGLYLSNGILSRRVETSE